MADPWKSPTFASSVYYEDPMAAIEVVRSAMSLVCEAPSGAVHDGFQKVDSS